MKKLIQDYINDFNSKQQLDYVVKPSIPVVWFGDMTAYQESKKKIVTIALNPSLSEFTEKRFEQVKLGAVDAVEKLAQTLNKYFKTNPYCKWFNNNFEKVLNCLDASYYENKKTNTAIHIDFYSAIATNPIWGGLTKEEKNKLKRTDLFKRLLKQLAPDVILFSANASAFKDAFADFELVERCDRINGKKSPFIHKYKHGKQILFNGRNFNGQAFGGLDKNEIYEVMNKIKDK